MSFLNCRWKQENVGKPASTAIRAIGASLDWSAAFAMPVRTCDISGGYYYAVMTESNWDTGVPLEYGARGLTIDSCKIHDTGRDCLKITPGSDRFTVRHTEIYKSGVRDPSNAEGIDNVNADSMFVQDCYIHDIATNGLYPKGGAIGCIIERCRFDKISQSAIVMGQNTDWQYFDSIVNPLRYESIDCIARNNIITNAGGAGIHCEAALRPKACNNTMVNVANTMRGAIQILGTDHYPPPNYNTIIFRPTRDPVIMNNIIVQSAGNRPAVFIVQNDSGPGLQGTLTMDYNRYYRTSGTLAFWDEPTGSYGLTFEKWQSDMHGESHSSVGDPKIDSTYHLVAGSPCIGAGQSSAYVVDDFDRQRRPANAIAIGADECLVTAAGHALFGRPSAALYRAASGVIALPRAFVCFPDGNYATVNAAGQCIAMPGTGARSMPGGVLLRAPKQRK